MSTNTIFQTLMKHTSIWLLALCAISTVYANVKMVKVASVEFPKVKEMTSIGLSGGAYTGGFAGLIASGGTLSVTYIDNGGGVVTGPAAGGAVEHAMWRGKYHHNNPGQDNAVLHADFDLTMQWKDSNGYHYDVALSGPAQLFKSALDKYLTIGSLDDNDFYEFFSGTFHTNNPNLQDKNFQKIVWETVSESINPDGTLRINADLYLVVDK